MTPRLIPEWAPQCGVLVAWPAMDTDWADIIEEAEASYVEIVDAIARRQECVILCRDTLHHRRIRDRLERRGTRIDRIRFKEVAYNDTWVRDYGPLTLRGEQGLLLRDFRFNGWGNKFRAEADDDVNRKLATGGLFTTPLERSGLVLEGGSIDTDGRGSLLTTVRCLLSPERNPRLGRNGTEQELKKLLGVERIFWLEHGYLAGDDTDSHVDTLARFCNERTICHVSCDDPGDEHFPELEAMTRELRALRDPDGNPFELAPLPWPSAKYAADGHRLPASYANFLIINGAVLVPTYRDTADGEALKTVARCFPDRKIIGIDCLPLIEQHGSLHCVTMQLPAGILG